MNAIKLLEQQHDEVDDLFFRADKETGAMKSALFVQVADALAIHSAIEEKLFYPAVKVERTEGKLRRAAEEHLLVKRIIADMLDLDVYDETFDAKLEVLRDMVKRHIAEERSEIFPQAKKILTREQLEALGQEMIAMIGRLEGSEPRYGVRGEIDAAAPL